ncbi:MAG: hypothetical protein CTY12_00365 [Methylotenera sp.]|nr:MAG: hypothetical protein CTY12_00365 [Methylotenera sp.]
MIYIKKLGNRVVLGGCVANESMLADGWEEYHGSIPETGIEFTMINGEIVQVEQSNDVEQHMITP